MTSLQLAGFLGCTTRHVFNLRRRGLHAYHTGKLVRFDITQVMEWLDSGSHTPGIDEREKQLAALASEQNDSAECAASDLCREFPNRK